MSHNVIGRVIRPAGLVLLAQEQNVAAHPDQGSVQQLLRRDGPRMHPVPDLPDQGLGGGEGIHRGQQLGKLVEHRVVGVLYLVSMGGRSPGRTAEAVSAVRVLRVPEREEIPCAQGVEPLPAGCHDYL